MKQYLKMVAAVLGAVLTALVPIFSLGSGVTAQQWVNVAIVGVSACVVFTAPNIPGAAYTKVIISALLAGLTVVVSVISGGISTAEWIQIGVAVLTALGVFGAKNTDKYGNNISFMQGVTNRDPVTGRFRKLRPVDGKDTP